MTAISRGRGRRAYRTTLTVGAVSLGLVMLAGCEKPSPLAHFTVGTNTTSREAADDCYGHGDALGMERALECRESDEDLPVLTTGPGDTLRIGVDPEIAEHGWLVFLNGRLWNPNPMDETYYTFDRDELSQALTEEPGQDPVIRLSIVEVGEEYDAASAARSLSPEDLEQAVYSTAAGIWNAEFRPED
jgi:hypothetical protein